jgi:hypothetical protein
MLLVTPAGCPAKGEGESSVDSCRRVGPARVAAAVADVEAQGAVAVHGEPGQRRPHALPVRVVGHLLVHRLVGLFDRCRQPVAVADVVTARRETGEDEPTRPVSSRVTAESVGDGEQHPSAGGLHLHLGRRAVLR